MTRIITFVQTYSEPNAILLPGRNTRLQEIQYTTCRDDISYIVMTKPMTDVLGYVKKKDLLL